MAPHPDQPAPRDATQQDAILTEARLEMLRQYVEWHGGVHAEDCPADDTCDCIGKPLNDAVNELFSMSFDRAVRATPQGGAWHAQAQALIGEMRTIRLVAGQCSVEGPDGTPALMAAAEAERCRRWADKLEAILPSSSSTPQEQP